MYLFLKSAMMHISFPNRKTIPELPTLRVLVETKIPVHDQFVEWLRYRFIYLGARAPLYNPTYISMYKETILTVLNPQSSDVYRMPQV